MRCSLRSLALFGGHEFKIFTTHNRRCGKAKVRIEPQMRAISKYIFVTVMQGTALSGWFDDFTYLCLTPLSTWLNLEVLLVKEHCHPSCKSRHEAYKRYVGLAAKTIEGEVAYLVVGKVLETPMRWISVLKMCFHSQNLVSSKFSLPK